jgi:hypothetical protein
MNKMKRYSSLFLCSLLVLVADFSQAKSNTEISTELTTIFRAARKVISVNQAHINDPATGDKGLSADTVIKKTKSNYKAATGNELTLNSDAKKAMILAIKDVMDVNQDLINEPGVGLKGLLPAIFARQMANKFTAHMNGKMKIKLTAPKKFVRNRANRADKWESNIIENLFRKSDYEKGKSFSEKVNYKGKEIFRFILPEYYGQSCLNCHGKPKGARDITGGKKEGGVLGELGGAISLIIF